MLFFTNLSNLFNDKAELLQAIRQENQAELKSGSINQNLKTDRQLDLIDSHIQNFKSAE